MRPAFVHAVLIVDGKYALQLRDEHVAVCPGHWGLFGGAIEPGETVRAALVREIREELELEVSHAEPIFRHGPWVCFAADVTSQWARHVLHEGQRAALFTYEEVASLKRNEMTDRALAAHRATT